MQQTVLVADDDEAIRDLLVMLLMEAGYKTLDAEDGRTAVDLALEHRPDIALLDVMMPVMDGFAACRALRADPRTADMPVLLLTALAQTQAKVQGLDDGAADYITKPFENLELLARLRAALGEKSRRDALVAEALTDPLTGLSNRRGLEQRLDQLLAHAIRTDETLSLLMFDADHFKAVNDTYGHEAGDAVLVTLAQRAKDTMRAQDVVGRLGGEEFVALLPGAGRTAAFTAAERLRSHIGDTAIDTARGAIRVTVSVGVATYYAGREVAPSTLLTAADGALYQAKRAGRNLVVHADGPPTVPLTAPEPPEPARALLAALALVHPPAAAHAQAVADLCWSLGPALRLSAEERARVALAALLHNVGMLAARAESPDVAALQAEHAALHVHLPASIALLRPLPALSSVVDLVAAHQERWDGSGYPQGLRREEIPLGSRIIAVVDTYDMLRRLQNGSATADPAPALQAAAGSHLDPSLVAAALRLLGR